MKGRRAIIALAVAVAALLGPPPASAEHGHTMRIGSDADGNGQMLLSWDFDGMPIARVSDSGFPGLFTGEVPGWSGAGATPPPCLFGLTAGTIVEVEVTGIEAGVSIGVTSVAPPSAGTLAAVGDVAIINTAHSLHNHPDFRLLTADPRTFGEGSVSFKVQENSGSSVG